MAVVLFSKTRLPTVLDFPQKISAGEKSRAKQYMSRMERLIRADNHVPKSRKEEALNDIDEIIQQLALQGAFRAGTSQPVINYDFYRKRVFKYEDAVNNTELAVLMGFGIVHLGGMTTVAIFGSIAVGIKCFLRRIFSE